MDHSNTIHSFAAVIGDIKDSRHLENRKEVQIRLQRILDRLNEKYKDDIVSRFLIKLGDEIQGLMSSGKYILDQDGDVPCPSPVRDRIRADHHGYQDRNGAGRRRSGVLPRTRGGRAAERAGEEESVGIVRALP